MLAKFLLYMLKTYLLCCMQNRILLKASLLFFLVLSVLAGAGKQEVNAQACTGTFSCCVNVVTTWLPLNCIPGDDCVSSVRSCAVGATRSFSCQPPNTGVDCDIYIPTQCQGFLSGSCNLAPPPTSCGDNFCNGAETCSSCPADCGTCPAPPPPAGSCTSGDCFTGIANCGVVGRDPGSGSCTGGLCCIPKSGYVAGCPYDVGQTGYPTCRFSEGNGCNASCSPPWGTCSGCADGLVGAACGCPSCSVDVIPDTATVDIGQTTDLAFSQAGNFNPSWSIQNSSPSVATAAIVGGVLRVSGISAGTARLTILGNWTGYSPRTVCSKVVTVAVIPPQCTVSLTPATTSINNGQSQLFSANLTMALGPVINVVFSVDNASLNASPSIDPLSPYTTTVTANSTGNGILTATVTMANGSTCSDTSAITVTQPGPWWQIGRGNAITPGGVRSLIPAVDPFIRDDSSSGFPGMVIYGTGTPDFSAGAGTGAVSSEGWLVQTAISANVYSYNYFNALASGRTFSVLPAGTSLRNNNFSSTPEDDGYRYLKVTGNASVSNKLNVNNAQKRVVVFVEGDLTIDNDISIDVTDGFLMFIVRGNIIVNPNVVELDGIFSVDGSFRTGTDGDDPQLVVTGSVVAGTLLLQRDLLASNGSSPAEIFIYSPELVVNFPPALSDKHLVWREVAP